GHALGWSLNSARRRNTRVGSAALIGRSVVVNIEVCIELALGLRRKEDIALKRLDQDVLGFLDRFEANIRVFHVPGEPRQRHYDTPEYDPQILELRVLRFAADCTDQQIPHIGVDIEIGPILDHLTGGAEATALNEEAGKVRPRRLRIK